MPGLIPPSVFVLTTGSHFAQLRNAAMTASPNTSLRNDSQESTQPTQERPKSEEPYPLSPEAWGSLIPCNIDHPRLSRVDFMKPKLKYTIGRGSRRSGAQCDVTFPKLQELSECPWDCELVEASRPDRSYVDSGRVHCTIEWNGDESATGSQVVITNLDATFGTWVRIGSPCYPGKRMKLTLTERVGRRRALREEPTQVRGERGPHYVWQFERRTRAARHTS